MTIQVTLQKDLPPTRSCEIEFADVIGNFYDTKFPSEGSAFSKREAPVVTLRLETRPTVIFPLYSPRGPKRFKTLIQEGLRLPSGVRLSPPVTRPHASKAFLDERNIFIPRLYLYAEILPCSWVTLFELLRKAVDNVKNKILVNAELFHHKTFNTFPRTRC